MPVMLQRGYTKLFSSIITSTIWCEPDYVRILWITMLALADRNGDVSGSVPGLAAMARISIENCEAGLACLSSPDPHSRSKEYDGRRVEVADGGWHILTYAKHRNLLSEEDRRQYNAAKQREYRKNVKEPVHMSPTSEHSVHIADAEADAEAVKSKPSPTKTVGGELGSSEFRQFYEAYPKKVDRQEAVRAWVKGICDGTIREILAGLEKWKLCEQWTDPDKIPYPSTWLNKRRWKEAPTLERKATPYEQKRERTKQAIERVRAELDR